MTNLKKCLVCGRVFRMSERHVCFDVAPSPASPWDPALRRENKKRGTRNRPHRPTVLLASPPKALTPQQAAARRRCLYCRRLGADVEIRTSLVTGPGTIVVFRHSQCRPKRTVECVECGAELGGGGAGHLKGCPFHPDAGTIPPQQEGSDG